MQASEWRPCFGAVAISLVRHRRLRQVGYGQLCQTGGTAAASCTHLSKPLQVVQHQVRESSHIVVHLSLRQVRQEAVVLRTDACHAAPSTQKDAVGCAPALLISRQHHGHRQVLLLSVICRIETMHQRGNIWSLAKPLI